MKALILIMTLTLSFGAIAGKKKDLKKFKRLTKIALDTCYGLETQSDKLACYGEIDTQLFDREELPRGSQMTLGLCNVVADKLMCFEEGVASVLAHGTEKQATMFDAIETTCDTEEEEAAAVTCYQTELTKHAEKLPRA